MKKNSKKRFQKGFYMFLAIVMFLATVGPSYEVAASSSDLNDDPFSDKYWQEALGEDINFQFDDEHWDYKKGDYVEGYFTDSYLLESKEYDQNEYSINTDSTSYLEQDYLLNNPDYEIQALQFLIPTLLPVIVRSGGKILVKQFLKKSTKMITVRNGHLAGKAHPITRVKFDKNGFPIFKSPYTAPRMPMSMIKNSNNSHFAYANGKLRNAVANSTAIRNKFSSSQLADIRNGKTPSSYTWHHHQNTGVLQLVKTTTHKLTGHTGGRAIWGTLD